MYLTILTTSIFVSLNETPDTKSLQHICQVVTMSQPICLVVTMSQPICLVVTMSQPICLVVTMSQPICLVVTMSQPICLVVTMSQPICLVVTMSQPICLVVTMSQPICLVVTMSHPICLVVTMSQPICDNVSVNQKSACCVTSLHYLPIVTNTEKRLSTILSMMASTSVSFTSPRFIAATTLFLESNTLVQIYFCVEFLTKSCGVICLFNELQTKVTQKLWIPSKKQNNLKTKYLHKNVTNLI